MHSAGNLPPWMILTSFHFFRRADSKYLRGKPALNLPQNLGITKGVLLIPYMRQLVINYMSFPDVAMVICPLLTL